MTPTEGTEQEVILIVDDDPDILRVVEVNLRLHGYEVLSAGSGAEALAVLETRRPHLALVDVMMPGMDGLELTRRLRADPMVTALPIIMLTAKALTSDKVAGLAAGADDYIVKPFDTSELLARVRATLRRNQEAREVSPLTGLPGNNRIQREIADRLRTSTEYAVCYVDIDRFKSVNDAYGFARGDEFITALARSLRRATISAGLPPAFLGHVGGDDFVIVCHPEQVVPITTKAVVDFEAASDELYDPRDAQRGYLELTDRRGNVHQINLVTISIGVALSTARRYLHPSEVSEVASEMKAVAKKHPGSWVSVDRRSEHLGLPSQRAGEPDTASSEEFRP
ncbi:MAG TPA: diguanylate cyclase response regulator [Micromonosporaceae bacterium]|nr:diguanylate cyclase response regulator [Micromonosporaceae bacterium]HCU49364.1 diguanylate cyclase response regulator [Micromonosporaceae bacterium]